MAEDREPASVERDWSRSVTVREDRDLAGAIEARLPPAGSPHSISVTELVAPRRAYWRIRGPALPPSPEREERMEGGRRLHRVLGQVFASTGELEVRVRREGLHGRIDLLTDRPVEVKTTGAPIPSDDLRASRPDHVDQLGMYAALLDQPRGRLVYLRAGTDRVEEVAAFDLEFDGLKELRTEMHARAAELRKALVEGRPQTLPRCVWLGRGCEYQQAGVCDCASSDPDLGPVAVPHASSPTPRPDLAGTLAETISRYPAPAESPVIERFRDLLYPRRAFFRRALPAPGVGPAERFGDASDLYRRLLEAVESGPLGSVTRLPTRSDEPDEEVGGLMGDPYVVRTSKLRARVPADDWIRRAPQYALELGFRCVATGSSRARLVVGYERLGPREGRLQVLELTFEAVSVFSRLWRHRAGLLARAIETDDPATLPACPDWMYESCDYRPACGCGAPGGRVQWNRSVEAVREKPSDS